MIEVDIYRLKSAYKGDVTPASAGKEKQIIPTEVGVTKRKIYRLKSALRKKI